MNLESMLIIEDLSSTSDFNLRDKVNYYYEKMKLEEPKNIERLIFPESTDYSALQISLLKGKVNELVVAANKLLKEK